MIYDPRADEVTERFNVSIPANFTLYSDLRYNVAWNKENFILFIQFPENFGKIISYNYEEGEQKVLLEGTFNDDYLTFIYISPSNMVLVESGPFFKTFDIDNPEIISTF
mmetsp:Transcript_20570/g.17983  ORF Transcript_20570/g.17983 Transcript_20570/m.17983 type:complete len:109 (+) Transcript_20570:494-820(+)